MIWIVLGAAYGLTVALIPSQPYKPPHITTQIECFKLPYEASLRCSEYFMRLPTPQETKP